MKKGLVEFAIFTSILLVLLSFEVFAVPPIAGTCSIVIPNECIAADGNYKIMGLSATTNAHAEFPYNGYPYVLCCGFATTEGTTCQPLNANKILGISSATNAHAEAPSQINYLTNVCYGDLQCKNSTSNCGTGDVSDYKLNLTSLSSVTNGHVGGINDFQIKICCKSAKYLSYCSIKSVGTEWNQAEANNEEPVYLTVKGSGSECSGQRLDIEVIGATKVNATSVSFTGDTALSLWTAEWQQIFLLGIPVGDKSYEFNATVGGVLSYAGKSMKSSNSLLVKQINQIDHCSTISSCGGYTDSNECNTDSCKKANADGVSQGYVCDSTKEYCSCSWSSGTCELRVSEIQAGLCTGGTTLCYDTATKVDYCYPGSTCPVGNNPITDGDAICETGEGCSPDCNGQQSSCAAGSTCTGGICSGTPPASVNCSYGFTLCQVSGTNYCYPGNTCPSGQIPPSKGDPLKCDPGEGCLTTPDCKDGDQDSCISGTYCSLGKCAAIQDPFTVGAVGGCKISQTVKKECNVDPVGYKIISWTGTWTGTGDDPSNPAYQKCTTGGSATIPCPAEIQLPFFDYYELAITIGVVALIYISLVFRRKLRKKKK